MRSLCVLPTQDLTTAPLRKLSGLSNFVCVISVESAGSFPECTGGVCGHLLCVHWGGAFTMCITLSEATPFLLSVVEHEPWLLPWFSELLSHSPQAARTQTL